MTTASTPFASTRAVLMDGWPAMLVILAVFITGEIAIGKTWGGAPIGAITGATIVGGRALLLSCWPDLSDARRRLALAGIALAGSVSAMGLLHVLW